MGKMAPPRNPNARPQNPAFILDALYCQEPHVFYLETEPEYEIFNDDNNLNVFKINRSSPDPVSWADQDPVCAEDELRFLISKGGGRGCLIAVAGRARREGVEWVLRARARHAFSAVTALLAVDYLERFLGSFYASDRREEKPWMAQLAAVACLSLAAKMEELRVPLLVDLQAADAKYVFEAKTIQRMEILVLSTLQWKMNPATPLSFVEYITRRLGLSWGFLRRCERLLLSAVRNSRFVCYPPSAMGMATALEAMDDSVESCIRAEFRNMLSSFPGLNTGKMEECGQLIRETMKESQCHAISNKRKLRSSLSPPLPASPSGVIDASFVCDTSDGSWATTTQVALSVSSSSTSSPDPVSKRNRGAPWPPPSFRPPP